MRSCRRARTEPGSGSACALSSALERRGSERDESFAAWARMLELIAASGPIVLVLEDLHWAGEAMLAFVEHLLSRELEDPAPDRRHGATGAPRAA